VHKLRKSFKSPKGRQI